MHRHEVHGSEENIVVTIGLGLSVGCHFRRTCRGCEGVKLVAFIGTFGSDRILGSDVRLMRIDFDGFRLCGSFFSFCFCSCRSVHSLMIVLTCSRVFLDGSFLMALVSSVVALCILSSWAIVGVWAMW